MKRFLMFCGVCLLSAAISFPNANGSDVPPWNGDVEKFSTNSSGQMEFTSPENEGGEVRLWRPLEHTSSMTWEIDVKLDPFSTNYNFIRMYVHASGIDTIYLQLGNNEGRMSICHKKGASGPKYLLSGRSIMADFPAGFVTVRLTLDKEQTWTLYTRRASEPTFYCEGSVTLAPVNPKHNAMLDLRFRYIKSRVTIFTVSYIKTWRYCFEPAEPVPEPEPEPPVVVEPVDPISEDEAIELQGTDILNSRELVFRFDREVDIADAICFESRLGEAMITGYEGSAASVGIRTMDPMTNGNEYSFTWQGLRNIDGNPIAEQTWNIKYDREETPDTVSTAEPLQVTINEVMANPNGLTALPATEYVELKNNTSQPVSLHGWLFMYDAKATVIDLPCILPPDGYAVLFREGREIYVDSAALSLGLSKFPAALANAGRSLALLDAKGRLIDRFTYPAAHAGLSWELSADGYHLCTDPRGGTPGAPNSEPAAPIALPEQPEEAPVAPLPESEIHPGDIVFNELLPEPNTDGSEYIELYNRTEQALSLTRLSIAIPKSNGSLTVYDLSDLNHSIPAGGYLVLTPDRAGVISQYNIHDYDAIREHKLPKLANTSATLLLINARNGGQVIDQITYNSQWHSPVISSRKGVALERIDPFGSTHDAANWTSASSTSGYGTPGYQNSQFGQAAATEEISITAPTWSGEDYQITYNLDAPAYACRIHIYNMQGLRVAEIASVHLMGTLGCIPWNGADLPTGVYIFHAEIYGPNGKSKQYKKPFLIR